LEQSSYGPYPAFLLYAFVGKRTLHLHLRQIHLHSEHACAAHDRFFYSTVTLEITGIEATRRGLDVLAVTDDPEGLHDQLLRSLDDLRQGENRGREVDVAPSVLADFRAVLALDLGAGLYRPITELCRELIPDLDQVSVKGPPQAPDLPPQLEQNRPPSAEKKHTQAKASQRAGRRRKRKKRR
jgi:hypothetical protein